MSKFLTEVAPKTETWAETMSVLNFMGLKENVDYYFHSYYGKLLINFEDPKAAMLFKLYCG